MSARARDCPAGADASRPQRGPGRGPVPGRGRLSALRSSATRDRIGRPGRQGRSRRGQTTPRLPKPDRVVSLPAKKRTTQVEGLGALSVVVRWGPVRTVVWHACGTVGEDNVHGPGSVGTSSTARWVSTLVTPGRWQGPPARGRDHVGSTRRRAAPLPEVRRGSALLPAIPECRP
jgi:hypothetical protein